MSYSLIWEVSDHEFSFIHIVLCFIAAYFLVIAIYDVLVIVIKKPRKTEKEEDINQTKRLLIVALCIIVLVLFCYRNDKLICKGTCIEYNKGHYYVEEGITTNYCNDGKNESFVVNGVAFDYLDSDILPLYYYMCIAEFTDKNNDIYKNGQKVRISYCKGENELFGRIAKVEIFNP